MLVVQYGQIIKKFEACVIWNQWRLVNGEELYDVARDRAQEKNVADQFPQVVRQMRDYYESWWQAVEPLVNEFVPISIGSPRQPVVELTSGDWEGIYADNTGHVRTAVGGPTGGHWHILVEAAGTYELTLRRWPEQTHAALGAKYDAAEQGPNSASRSFPSIARARVAIAGASASAKADPQAQGVNVEVKVPAGKTTLEAWFQDADGADLCGAFFVTAKRKQGGA
jgi:hypothetical protein